MSHPEQQQYCRTVKLRFPKHFMNRKVLDVGSLNINGHNRFLFEGCDYTGLDIAPGSNVDVVSKAHEYKPGFQFDTIISTEMLEHDPHWQDSFRNMVDLLAPGGLLLMTCASPGRMEHGTRRSQPACSPLTVASGGDWADYYRNLSEQDIRPLLNDQFDPFEFETDNRVFDLRFWGIKR